MERQERAVLRGSENTHTRREGGEGVEDAARYEHKVRTGEHAERQEYVEGKEHACTYSPQGAHTHEAQKAKGANRAGQRRDDTGTRARAGEEKTYAQEGSKKNDKNTML